MKYLKALREKRGVSQNQLGALINKAPSTISNYENGAREPSLDDLCALADFFDVTLDVLVRGKEKDRQQCRSIKDLVNDFDSLTDEHLEMMIEVAQAVLAERRLLARQKKDGKQTP